MGSAMAQGLKFLHACVVVCVKTHIVACFLLMLVFADNPDATLACGIGSVEQITTTDTVDGIQSPCAVVYGFAAINCQINGKKEKNCSKTKRPTDENFSVGRSVKMFRWDFIANTVLGFLFPLYFASPAYSERFV